MKTVIYIILGIIWFLWIGKFSIKLIPLRIEFPEWKLAIAWLIMAIGITSVLNLEYQKTYEKGFNDCKDDVIHAIDSIKLAEKQVPLEK